MADIISPKVGEVLLLLRPRGNYGFSVDILDRTESDGDRTLSILANGLAYSVLNETDGVYTIGLGAIRSTMADEVKKNSSGQLLIRRLVPNIDVRYSEIIGTG